MRTKRKPAAAAAARRQGNDIAAEREMIRVWSNGLDWPVIGWIAVLASGGLGRAVLLHVGRPVGVLPSFLGQRQPGGLPGLPPPLDPRQFSDVSLGPPPVRPAGDAGRRRPADHLGRGASQAPSLQRSGRAIRTRRTTAAGGATCFGCSRGPRIRSGKKCCRPTARTCSRTRSSACSTRRSCSGTSGWG